MTALFADLQRMHEQIIDDYTRNLLAEAFGPAKGEQVHREWFGGAGPSGYSDPPAPRPLGDWLAAGGPVTRTADRVTTGVVYVENRLTGKAHPVAYPGGRPPAWLDEAFLLDGGDTQLGRDALASYGLKPEGFRPETPQQRALPRPSHTPPMWAITPNRRRRQ